MSKLTRAIASITGIAARAKPRQSAERFVFVVTYGRSGSTILMKLINAMDGFDIKGENNGAIQQLIESVRCLETGQEQYGGTATESVEHPWYGLNRVSLRQHTKQTRRTISEDFLAVGDGKTVGGFKEIRYFQISDKAFDYHIDFLLDFPDSKIIFLTREAEQVMKSAWWKERDPEETLAMLTRMDRLFVEANAQRPGTTRMFDYSQITDYAEFAQLAEFLEGEMSEEQHAEICAHKINQST